MFERGEFLRGFYAFGDDGRADVVAEGDERGSERSAAWVEVDSGDEAPVEFDDVGAEFQDVLEAGVPAPAGASNN